MHRAKAIGGPRDGVVIIADTSWSGLIRGHLDGQYKWDPHTLTWNWTARVVSPAAEFITAGDDPEQKQTRKRRATPRLNM